jgi:hypothetical protein
MIAEVKGARLLHGFRGRSAADLEALADTLVRVSYLAMHLEGTLGRFGHQSAHGAAGQVRE